MERISENQRVINIINRALELGFKFDEDETIEDIKISAEEFLIQNTTGVYEECEVKQVGREQRVDWHDRKGFEFWAQGEIIDFRTHWFQAPDTKVVHHTVLDSLGQVVHLYYLVGETDYNAPEGFFYDAQQNKHIKD